MSCTFSDQLPGLQYMYVQGQEVSDQQQHEDWPTKTDAEGNDK